MGPEYQKYIWWKKYLTAFQMVSFDDVFDCSAQAQAFRSSPHFRFNLSLFSLTNSSCFGRIANTRRASWCGSAFTASCSYSSFPTFTSRTTSKGKKDWKTREGHRRMEKRFISTTITEPDRWVDTSMFALTFWMILRNFLALTRKMRHRNA